jgi:polyisoprenoid-binding protein YceI
MLNANWGIDPTHSEIGFKVKHLMITTVSGKFAEFDASVEAEQDDFSDAKISFFAHTATVSTGNEQRDGHLRSADFFDAETFPKLSFESTSFEGSGSERVLNGHLTIKDQTHPVSLKVEFSGVAKDPWGNHKAGFTLEGKISRSTWGLNWNAALETGGVLVSDEVKIFADIQLLKK